MCVQLCRLKLCSSSVAVCAQLSLGIMSGSLDPFKVFIGGLRKECFKPTFKTHLEWYGLQTEDVFMPQNHGTGPSIAFCTFWTVDDAQRCISIFNGMADAELTHRTLEAGGIITEAFKVFR